MSSTTTVIGANTFIKGRLTGGSDLEIAGRFEGELLATGDVLVAASALVASNISARVLIVRGAVRGDLTATESISIEEGARVVGDLRAPRIAIAAGGLVRGHVETGAAAAIKTSSPRTTAPAVRAMLSAPRQTVIAATIARAPVPATKPAAPATIHSNGHATEARAVAPIRSTPPARAAASPTRAAPPAPVLPVLKKGTKATQKTKRA